MACMASMHHLHGERPIQVEGLAEKESLGFCMDTCPPWEGFDPEV